MIRPAVTLALLLAALAGEPAALAQGETVSPALSTDSDAPGLLRWTYQLDDDGRPDEPRLHFARDGVQVSLERKDAPEVMTQLATSALARPGEPIAFTLAREAGTLTCEGRVAVRGEAEGTCAFAPSRAFAAELARRGIPLEDPADEEQDLLGLTLVDAKLVSIDIFAQAGLPMADVDDLMLVSALNVTPAFRDDLRAVGLEFSELDELASAKAIGVDPAWVREMAAAGFAPRDSEQAIEMRALNITPDYARRMARVIAETGSSEE